MVSGRTGEGTDLYPKKQVSDRSRVVPFLATMNVIFNLKKKESRRMLLLGPDLGKGCVVDLVQVVPLRRPPDHTAHATT